MTDKPRKRFRPHPILTALSVLVLAGLLYLGTWQARRFQESSAHVELYRQQHDVRAPVTSMAEAAGQPDRVTQLHYRRARIQGRLLGEQAQLLTARYKFGKLGYGVAVPVEVDGPHRLLLVHLGWVPKEKATAYLATLKTQPPQQFEGRLRTTANLPLTDEPVSTVDGRPVWRYLNPAAMARKLPGLDPELLLDAGQQAEGKTVDPEKVPLDGYTYPVHPLPPKHIEYSATWYGLALTLVAVWFTLSWRADKPA